MNNEEVIGLVPAAGKGVRLGLPYPKELYPVIRDNHYKPISQFVLNNLTTAGVQHVVFVINETKHQLVGYFGDGHRFGCHISYVVQEAVDSQNQSTSPGLAHALDSAYHLTQGKTVFFGMADTIMQPGDAFANAFKEASPEDDVILVLFPTERPEKFGMVRLDNDNRVLEIVDKPRQTDLTKMWGCIIWRPRFTEHLHESVRQGISDFAQIMNNAIAAGFRFRGSCVVDGVYIDLGTYEEIMELDRRFREE
ncbi:MAG: NTP transferase domain-containing protein [Anaerolineales bacterium]|nr:NTP transferase domain-containing protein [Anaerolineales bacterium]